MKSVRKRIRSTPNTLILGSTVYDTTDLCPRLTSGNLAQSVVRSDDIAGSTVGDTQVVRSTILPGVSVSSSGSTVGDTLFLLFFPSGNKSTLIIFQLLLLKTIFLRKIRETLRPLKTTAKSKTKPAMLRLKVSRIYHPLTVLPRQRIPSLASRLLRIGTRQKSRKPPRKPENVSSIKLLMMILICPTTS